MNTINKTFLGLLIVFIQLITIQYQHAAVVQMHREEIIQLSKFIFTGKVLKKECKLNKHGNLIITEYTFKVNKVLYGSHSDKEIILSFAGGQLYNETHKLSDVPEFSVDDEVLLMIEDKNKPLFSPVTGMYQGKFVKEKKGLFSSTVIDGHQKSVTNKSGQKPTFSQFVEIIKREIVIAKSKPLPDRSIAENLRKYVLTDTKPLIYESNNAKVLNSIFLKPEAPPAISSNLAAPDTNNAVYNSNGTDSLFAIDNRIEWSYSHRAKHVPVVYNQFPPGHSLHRHDEYQMAYWNQYADIFRIRATPTGTWAWKNDRYDMCGFVSESTLRDQFDRGWGSKAIAICFIRWDITGKSIEADIALNPSVSWTTDDYASYHDRHLHNVHFILLHELGHAWGLEHQFYALSVVNYPPHKYRAYSNLYADDCAGIRAAFPLHGIGLSDLNISLYRYVGYQDYDDSDLSAPFVIQGQSFTISNFIIQNTGLTITNPVVHWYLSPDINSTVSNYYLGYTTHGSLEPDHSFNSSRTLNVPDIVPPGQYFVRAEIVNVHDVVGRNNNSWCGNPISVVIPPPDPPEIIVPVHSTKLSDRTPLFDWSSVSTALQYQIQVDNNPNFQLPEVNVVTPSTHYTPVGNLTIGRWYFRVRSFNHSGWGNWSPTLYFNIIPHSPDGVTASNGTYTDKVRIVWAPVFEASHYKVYRSTMNDINLAIELTDWQTSTVYLDGSAFPGAGYYYWVKAATNKFGLNESFPSSSDFGYRALEVPSFINASDGIITDYINVSWENITGARYYIVYRGTIDNHHLARPISGWLPTNSFNDSSALPCVDYYYWVRAATSNIGHMITPYSGSDMGYRGLNAPANFTASDGLCDTVYLSWDSVYGAESYLVYLNEELIDEVVDTQFTHMDAPLTPNEYRVYASKHPYFSLYSSDNGYQSQSPEIELGNDTVGCDGDTILLNAGNTFDHYYWSTSDTTQSIKVTESGLYYVMVSDNSCTGSDSIDVYFSNLPHIDLGSDTAICKGDTVQLDAGVNREEYLWSTSDTVQYINVGNSGVYWVKVSENSCFNSDSIWVEVNNLPIIELGADSTICDGEMLQLNAGAGFDFYFWSTDSVSQSIDVFSSGNYSVTVTLNNCSNADSINVTVTELPQINLGNDTIGCEGDIIELNAGIGFDEYFWNTLETTQLIDALSAGLYSVTVLKNNCSNSDSIIVNYTALPIVLLGADTNVLVGSSILLDAGNGFENYLWSTGEETQTIVIENESPGTYQYYVDVTDSNFCVGSDTINIFIDVNSIHEYSDNVEIGIYPNPAQNQLYLSNNSERSLEKFILSVFTLKGDLILRKEVPYLEPYEQIGIDFSKLQPGVYLLQIDLNELKIHHKLIKQ